MGVKSVLFDDVLSTLISTFQRKSSLLPMGKYILRPECSRLRSIKRTQHGLNDVDQTALRLFLGELGALVLSTSP
jgi:hypothetical protein